MYETLDNEPTLNPELPLKAELFKGQFLGEKKNYCLEEMLGVGGMGEVWLATKKRPGGKSQKVVCKTIRKADRENQDAQDKILKQFMRIQKLNHQNICPIYTIEEDPAYGHLIEMGYADGGSFKDWFEKQPKQNGGLPVKTVCNVLRPIADALDFAHRKGVIHRDVKPENMMFTSDQTPWLIDFGIATDLHSETRATTSQYASSGTVSYMAPEQKTGQLQTAQTDEYSLAVVALEFLTGTTFVQAVQMLSPEIQQVLNKGLAFRSSDRYATCREFIDALAGTTLEVIPDDPFAAFFAEEEAKEEARRRKLPELALDAYQSGKHAEAAEYLREYLKYHPENENAKRLLARCESMGTTLPASSIRRDDVPVVQRTSSSAEVKKSEPVSGNPEPNVSGSRLRPEPSVSGSRLRPESSVSGSRLRPEPNVSGSRLRPEPNVSGSRLRPESSVSGSRLRPLLKAGDRKIWTVSGIDYAFRWCPPGEFMMGSTDCSSDEKPVHNVRLTKGFWLMETQVTQIMWELVMGSNPSKFKGASNPVEYVSWNDCQEFCKKLSKKLGQQVQLPTEVQWEYACRAGTTSAYAGSLDGMGWYRSNSGSKTHEVGLKKPNAWGLCDMHGNVYEWCSDWYDEYYYSQSPTNDPTGPNSGSSRVIRGGCWSNYAVGCRSACRSRGNPVLRDISLGLRVVLVPTSEE